MAAVTALAVIVGGPANPVLRAAGVLASLGLEVLGAGDCEPGAGVALAVVTAMAAVTAAAVAVASGLLWCFSTMGFLWELVSGPGAGSVGSEVAGEVVGVGRTGRGRSCFPR